MEQKRTLWIVAAAGVFLLVVIGAALILYSPSLHKPEQVRTYSNPADGWVVAPKNAPGKNYSNGVPPVHSQMNEEVPPCQFPFENKESENFCNDPENFRNRQESFRNENDSHSAPIKADNVTVITDNALVYGTGSTTTIDLNSLKSNSNSAAPVITPKNEFTADKINTQAQTQSQAKVQAPAASSENYYAPAAKPMPKKEASPAPVKKETTKPAAKKVTKAAPKASPKPVAPDTFWIQVGSYEAKKIADEARSILESNKIPNEVFTYKDTKGKLFYRVRVGPYTTKSEAEYWQSRIKMINEFAKTNSYVVKN